MAGLNVIGAIIDNLRNAIKSPTPGTPGARPFTTTIGHIANLFTGSSTRLSDSIVREAKKSIATFPMIVANSIPMESIFKIDRKMENSISHLLLLCIQNGNDLIDLKDPEAKSNFIKKFTSTDSSMRGAGLTDVIFGRESFTAFSEGKLKEVAPAVMSLESHLPRESFDLTLLYNKMEGISSNPEDDEETLMIGTVAPVSALHKPILQPVETETTADADEETANEAFQGGANNNVAGGTKAPAAADKGKDSATGSGNGGNHTKPQADNREKRQADIDAKIEKKIDSLAPTIVTADVLVQDANGGIADHTTRVAFGVKTTVTLVDSNEMVEAMKDVFSESSLLVRLIRWKVGELSFVKDVLLNMKEMKSSLKHVSGRSGGSSAKAIFSNLRFSVQNAIAANAATTKNGGLLPTAILVLTEDEVESLKRSCSKDIYKNLRDAKELSEKLALFAIVIMDAPNDIAHIFYNDKSMRYDTVTLKKDSTKDDDEGMVKAIFGALRR